MPEPFLKWAGGKRWMVSQHDRLFPYVYGRYVEPFLGGGAVFFYLQPQNALLSDKNAELVNVYQSLRENPKRIQRLLQSYHNKHTEDFYYRWRGRKQANPLHRAARFLYLNRVCFNGLFRVNLRGEFNVPIGTKTLVRYPRGYLTSISRVLQRAQIVQSDFEDIIDRTTAGDFVYIDPPYTVMHNNNNFLKYNDVLFSWADQIRLAGAVRRATRRGALVLVSNADHVSIRQLYHGFGYLETLKRASILSGDSAARRSTSEIAVRNYVI